MGATTVIRLIKKSQHLNNFWFASLKQIAIGQRKLDSAVFTQPLPTDQNTADIIQQADHVRQHGT